MATKVLKTTAGVVEGSLSYMPLPLPISLVIIGVGSRSGGFGISPSSKLSDVSMIILLERKRGNGKREEFDNYEIRNWNDNCRRNLYTHLNF